MPSFCDITGQKFGRLVALSPTRGTQPIRWLCRCECGTEKAVPGTHLRNATVRSCGCLQRELVAARLTTHGKAKTREHRAWSGMRTRCTNPRRAGFKNYGGRGITLAPEWEDFETFLRDVGPRPGAAYSLDRIDNDRGYEPGNVRWATRTEQNRNQRRARIVEYQGRPMSLAEAAERAGVGYWTAHSRLRRGWSAERALSPVVAPGERGAP